MANNAKNNLVNANLVLLGLLMLVPGLLKLFVQSPSGVSGFLSGMNLFAWAPMFWAIVLIIAEIGSGVAILTRWKLKYTAYIPVIILAVGIVFATDWSTVGKTSLWTRVFFHLIAIANYLMLAHKK
ncbi:MAG: DoxX family membrane protein [Candidatus Pacearchaeota archaeon]